MADIVINMTAADPTALPLFKGVTHDPSSTPIKLTLTNFDNLVFDLDTPVAVFAIPEGQVKTDDGTDPDAAKKQEPIIIKVEGNTMTISVSWTLKIETSTIATGGVPALPVITSVGDQLEFLFKTFQNRGIKYKYNFTADSFSNTDTLITKLIAQKTSGTPVTYLMTMTMVVGDTQTTVSEGS